MSQVITPCPPPRIGFLARAAAIEAKYEAAALHNKLFAPIRVLAVTDPEMALAQAYGVIKSLCRERELLQRPKHERTFTVMGVKLCTETVVHDAENHHTVVYLAGSDTVLEDGEVLDAVMAQVDEDVRASYGSRGCDLCDMADRANDEAREVQV